MNTWQAFILALPTKHAPQLQRAAELCAAKLTNPSAAHQPYSVLAASPQELAAWEEVPLTGRRRLPLPPADPAQQWWLWRLVRSLDELPSAVFGRFLSPEERKAVLEKSWQRMAPSGACLAIPETACCALPHMLGCCHALLASCMALPHICVHSLQHVGFMPPSAWFQRLCTHSVLCFDYKRRIAFCTACQVSIWRAT